MKRAALALTLALLAVASMLPPAGASTRVPIKTMPRQVNFGTRQVGTETLKGVTVRNTGSQDLLVLVEGRLPDDFGFGLLPGTTCPALTPGDVLDAGESCKAVVRFTPSEFFAGSIQTGELLVTARDPRTGALVATASVPIRARGAL